jgi:XTP/dITP diphosphohydrolase
MSTLILASGNRGKQREFAELLAGTPWQLRLQSEFGVTEAAETGLTFVENALIKARHAAHITGLPTVADDSGIVCDALGGAPGVESAYYAGPQGDGAANLQKLVAVMRDVPDARRGAHFVCVLLLRGPDGAEMIFEGRCAGHLQPEPRGGAGFGYDPIFVPAGHTLSFSELGEAVADLSPHRDEVIAALELLSTGI